MTLRPLIYGTSGFRAKADEQLQLIVYRAAFYAAARAKKLGKAVGIMITASHNPGCDNGLKLVDPSGRMLAMECEEELTKIANGTEEEFEKFKNEEIQQIKNNEEKDNPTPIIVIATDTRPSSAILYEEAVKGIKLLGIFVDIKYFEHHTTPQLHYIVKAINEKKPVDDYIQQFRRALGKSREFLNVEENKNLSPLYLDCANGVGSLWIAKYLENNGFICKNGLDVTKNEEENLDKNNILVNLFNTNTNDGELLNNGNIKPLLTKTGTKHLEEAALNYDIGIYFEANGHGTVYFSDKFYKLIKEGENGKEKEQVPRYIKLLSLFSKLVNEVDGDAIADLLTVEFLLRYFNWTIQDWEKNTYSNCPSFQLKVPVSNRNLFVTPEDNETKLLQPIGIQNKIDECVSKFLNSRAFIRPSGTEQIVRIYSEANSLEEAKQLANELEKIVKAEALKE
uniref:Phosphoacetylglucosamine mutase n=1 Tax=Meloidogyne javanica TaxID=6303 RepID=A0A915LLJ7_MELJA